MLDKCYSKATLLKGKKVGILIIGGASTSDPQYTFIKQPFDCMTKYLNWDILFYQTYSASGKNELAHNETAMAEMRKIGSSL
ncbi:MAG: hypothetical protein MJ071_00915 [Oscillospiraceae bacterium]|nr:hypothetical protein [Oscillospiraceae bacterium]